MDQVPPSTYFAIVVILQNNAERAVLHRVSNILALKKKQTTSYGKEGMKEEI